MSPSATTVTLLEKVAVDNGFDLNLPRDDKWLGFASTQAPLRLWLTTFGDAVFIAAISQAHVARGLADYGTPLAAPLPSGAAAGRSVIDLPALHRLVRRAFQLSRALPDEPLQAFLRQIATLPTTTEADRLVVVRIGQDMFRAGLLDFWEGRCAVTGLAVPDLLRASHIKPWAVCATDAERLDVWNGLLLAPHLDAAFDRGFITIADDGTVTVSTVLLPEDRGLLGLDEPLRLRSLSDGHRRYLPWHRDKIFRK